MDSHSPLLVSRRSLLPQLDDCGCTTLPQGFMQLHRPADRFSLHSISEMKVYYGLMLLHDYIQLIFVVFRQHVHRIMGISSLYHSRNATDLRVFPLVLG